MFSLTHYIALSPIFILHFIESNSEFLCPRYSQFCLSTYWRNYKKSPEDWWGDSSKCCAPLLLFFHMQHLVFFSSLYSPYSILIHFPHTSHISHYSPLPYLVYFLHMPSSTFLYLVILPLFTFPSYT